MKVIINGNKEDIISKNLFELVSEKKLEQYFNKYFSDTRLSELIKPCLVTAYDTERRSSFFFTSHNAAERGRDFLVRDVARATSAAPTYFEAAGIKSLAGVFYSLVDGGLFANNPAMCAYAEARKTDFGWINKPVAADIIMLSLGTGRIEKQYLYEDIKNWGVVSWIRPLIDIMMSGVSETVDHQLTQIYKSVNSEQNYLRIAPDLEEASPEMDLADRSNIKALVKAGKDAVEANRRQLDMMAEMLVNK